MAHDIERHAGMSGDAMAGDTAPGAPLRRDAPLDWARHRRRGGEPPAGAVRGCVGAGRHGRGRRASHRGDRPEGLWREHGRRRAVGRRRRPIAPAAALAEPVAEPCRRRRPAARRRPGPRHHGGRGQQLRRGSLRRQAGGRRGPFGPACHRGYPAGAERRLGRLSHPCGAYRARPHRARPRDPCRARPGRRRGLGGHRAGASGARRQGRA